MNAALFFYAADVLGSINVIAALTGIIGGGVGLLFTAMYYSEENEYHGKNWILWVPAVALCISVLIPGTKTMYMMAASVLGEQAFESQVGQKLKEMVELKLDEELDKLRKEKK